jgi:hypothetical protein
MDHVGETILHTVDFVDEADGVAIRQTKQRLVQLSYDLESCKFVFDWGILLDAGGRLPRPLADLLVQMRNIGFRMYAIQTSGSPHVAAALPDGGTPFLRVYEQQENQDSVTFFRRCYRRMGESNVIFFGGDGLVDAVLDQRQDKDSFNSVEPNPDTMDGTPSYLEEMLAMVLVVQAGKAITSCLEITY